MSKETLAAFMKKVVEDKALGKEFTQLAADHGFEFALDELSETDLEDVAGGASIKLRAKSTGGEVSGPEALITHPMETGQRPDNPCGSSSSSGDGESSSSDGGS